MKVEIVGKNGFTPTEAIANYAETKLVKVEQFFSEDTIPEARIVCKVYSDHHKVEVTIPTKSLLLRAEVCDDDMYAAIDRVVDKLLSQIRKHKEKVKNKFEKEGIKEAFSNSNLDIDAMEKQVLASQLVKNKQVELVPMDPEEAISRMELMDHKFFVFLDKTTSRVSVVYLRDDGDYAVIETN